MSDQFSFYMAQSGLESGHLFDLEASDFFTAKSKTKSILNSVVEPESC